MSDFVALNTALTALRAARLRIDTAANNVANASTPGYTRQRVDLATNPVDYLPAGQIGTGVKVIGVTRLRDMFLDARVRAANEQVGETSVRAQLLDRVELILGEPDQGVSGPLADVWASFEDLAHSPTSSGARTAVLSTLDQLAGRLRTIAEGWDRLAKDASDALTTRVDEANDLLTAVAELNHAIASAPPDNKPNDLLDKRDHVLDALALKLGVQVSQLDDGTVRVSLDGVSLVEHERVDQLVLQPDFTLATSEGGTMAGGGEIAGYRTFLTVDLPRLRDSLNDFAKSFADALNVQHQQGWVSDTEQGGALLSATPGDEAKSLRVAVTDPSKVAASADPGPPFPVHNGVNGQALAELRRAPVAQGGTDTLDGAVRTLAVDLGGQVASARRATEGQMQIAAAADVARKMEHGVSLDEELTYMMEAQHAYQAASRVLTAVDEAMDTLINRTGLVGR